jgi:hypothetical protein
LSENPVFPAKDDVFQMPPHAPSRCPYPLACDSRPHMPTAFR